MLLQDSDAKAQPSWCGEPQGQGQAEQCVPFDGIPFQGPDLGWNKMGLLRKLEKHLQLQKHTNLS